MYCNFFGLRCRPFESRVDTQFTYITPEYEETLAAVEYEVRFGRKLALVLGETGTGKTQLIRTLLQRFHRTDHALVIKCHVDSKMDLILETYKGYGLTLSTTENQQDRINRLRRHLLRNTRAENRWILIIDQAENLSAENLSQLATLADVQGEDGQLLSVVLVAQPRFRSLIDQSSLDRIRQHLVNARMIYPYTASQTEEYIRHRLIVAGASDSKIFDEDAIALIHEASGGVPRLINHYSNAVMLAAYGAEKSQITPQIVLEVTRSSIPQERSVTARELGLKSSRQVEAGQPPCSSPPVMPSPTIRRSFQTPSSVDADTDGSYGMDRETTGQNTSHDSRDAGLSSQGRYQGLTVDMESLFASGEALLQRLERALARADRMTGTTEASMSQFMAVEKHIDTVTTSTERYINQLAESLQRGNDSLDKLQNRLQQHHDDTDHRLSKVESHMTRVIKASDEIEERIERANRVCDRVDQAQANVKRSVEKLADKAEDIHQHMTRLKTGVKAGEDVQVTLEHLTKQSLSDLSEAEAKVHKLMVNVQERIRRGEQLSEQFSDAALERYHVKYQQQLEEYEQLKKEAIASCQEKLQSQVNQYQEALNETLALRLAKSQAKLETMVNTTRREIEEMSRRVELVESKRKQAEQWAKPLCQDAEKVADQIVNLHERLKKVSTTVDEMSARAESTSASVSATVQRGEQLLSGVQTSQSQIEAERNQVAVCLTEINRAADRVQELRDQTRACEQAFHRLAFENESGEKTVQRIQQLSEHVEQLHTNLQLTVTEAAEKLGQLTSRTESAGGVIHNLSELNANGENTVEKVEAVVRNARDAMETVSRQADRWDDVRKISETLEEARQLYDAMQGLMSHTDVKIGELETCHVAAARTLEDLSKHKSHVDLFLERTNQAEEAAEKINRLIEDVWSLTTRTETENKQLSKNVEQASQLLEKLASATDPARSVAGELAEKTAQMDQYRQEMDKGLARAGKLVGRLAAITRVLSAAKDTEASVKSTVEEVRAAHNELAATVEDAARHSTTLQDLSTASQDLIQTQHQLRQETQSTTEELARQLATTQSSVETGERLLKDFIIQAETLNDRFVALDKKAGEIKNTVEDSLNKPATVMKNVNTQIAQLEKVSAAVRKVFTGLSKATLEAQQQANELKQSTQNSNQQVSAIKTQTRRASQTLHEWIEQAIRAQSKLQKTFSAQTQRASQTLHEWIEEAIRAQSRLQKTLGECPSIQETHPREALMKISRLSSIARDSSLELSGELQTLNEPDSTTSPMTMGRLAPPDGADEIARMIEDAKRATSDATG